MRGGTELYLRPAFRGALPEAMDFTYSTHSSTGSIPLRSTSPTCVHRAQENRERTLNSEPGKEGRGHVTEGTIHPQREWGQSKKKQEGKDRGTQKRGRQNTQDRETEPREGSGDTKSHQETQPAQKDLSAQP